jgi:hypothetical protein
MEADKKRELEAKEKERKALEEKMNADKKRELEAKDREKMAL